MPSLDFDEMRILFPDYSSEKIQFNFDVIGGNPRYFVDADEDVLRGAKFYNVVERAVTWMFGAEYVPLEDSIMLDEKRGLGKWAINILVEILEFASRDATSSGTCRTDSSVFTEYIVSKNYGTHDGQFSSVFMGYLAGLLKNGFGAGPLYNLRRLFGASGMDNAFEFTLHAQLADTDEMYWCLSSSGDYVQLQLGNRRKKLIRNVNDIASLCNGDYGLPTSCNFPILDAVLPPNIGLQMTSSRKHECSVRRLPDILQILNIRAVEFIVVFIVSEEKLAHFSFPRNLGEVKMYVTVPTPVSDNAFRKLRLARKKNCEDD